MSKTRKRKVRVVKPLPGYEGAAPIGMDGVPDPYEIGARLVVARRITIIRHWHSRRQIDDAQRAAGEWLEQLHERAQLRSPSCIDYGKPLVDGGKMQEPLTDAVMRARHELMIVAGVLGKIDYPLVVRVVCEGVRVEDEAQRWPGDRPERYVARRVRDALTALAEWRGTKGRDRAPMRSHRAVETRIEEPIGN